MNFQVVLTSCLRGTQTHKRSLEVSQAKIKKKKKENARKKKEVSGADNGNVCGKTVKCFFSSFLERICEGLVVLLTVFFFLMLAEKGAVLCRLRISVLFSCLFVCLFVFFPL